MRGFAATRPAPHLVVGLMLAALLISFILIAIDCHELLRPFSRCSVCQVKNDLSGSSEKSVVIDLSMPGQAWRLTPFVTVERRCSDDVRLVFAKFIPTPGAGRAPPV